MLPSYNSLYNPLICLLLRIILLKDAIKLKNIKIIKRVLKEI